MALDPATLATELKKAPEFPADEAATIAKWSAAWQVYWEESEAVSAATVAAETSPAAAVAAFEGALAGISAANTAVVAATKIKDACKGFWTAATPALAYLTVPSPVGTWLLLPPFMLDPGAEAAFVAALAAVFTANMTGSVSKDDSMDALAAAINTGQAGATFLDTTPPASAGPLTYTVG